MYEIFFLFSFLLICCLSGAGIPVACGIIFTSSYFYLLMEPSALLTVLHVYSLRWLFIALPIYGVLKIFVKAVDVVAKIL